LKGTPYHNIYLPDSLDKFVCKASSRQPGMLNPSLMFFLSEEDFKNDKHQFIWQASNDCRYEAMGFLNQNIFVFTTSTFGRFSFTGEKRLYLYDFTKKRIIVNHRLTSLLSFSPALFQLKDIAVTKSGKYLAYSYDKDVSIYELP
jgi:hypothetical protein